MTSKKQSSIAENLAERFMVEGLNRALRGGKDIKLPRSIKGKPLSPEMKETLDRMRKYGEKHSKKDKKK
jgi:hypothetical protein